ncbi:MAG: serine--tRNA ligase [Alphaproteobacteria bacterium]
MFDIRWIRDNANAFDKGLAMRGLAPLSEELLALDDKRREAMRASESLTAERNALSKQIGIIKREGGNADDILAKVSQSKEQQAALDSETESLNQQLNDMLIVLPNIPLDDVPYGESEDDNIEVKKHGIPTPFDFTPKEHWELGENLKQMDFETAAKLSGSRFVVLKNELARLERAIGAFMLDIQTTENKFMEYTTPVLVRENALFGTGQFPKFMDDVYATKSDDFYLIPTAEVTLTNTVAGDILQGEFLPQRMTALTNCFRAEAGSAGRDTRGMIRQHQFNKVEMVSVCKPEQGEQELDYLVKSAEIILQKLNLPYRILLLCSQDMGAGARKTFDLEVWLPGQDKYREISSISLCGDYQARRMNTRFKEEGKKGTQFAYTLNGSGLAVGRTLIAVMENYQNADGSINIPVALQPYMGGQKVIKAN